MIDCCQAVLEHGGGSGEAENKSKINKRLEDTLQPYYASN